MPTTSGTFSSAAIVSAGTALLDFVPGTISNILVLDGSYNQYASSPPTGIDGSTDLVKAYGPSATVPALATINTITISLWKYATPGGGTVVDGVVKLVKAGVVEATDYASAAEFDYSAIALTTYAIPGTGWTAVDVNDSGFGVAFSAAITNGVFDQTLAYWDAVAYEIDYSEYVPPGATLSVDQHFYDGATYHRDHEGKAPEEGTRFVFPVVTPTAKSDRNLSADPISEYTEPDDPIND